MSINRKCDKEQITQLTFIIKRINHLNGFILTVKAVRCRLIFAEGNKFVQFSCSYNLQHYTPAFQHKRPFCPLVNSIKLVLRSNEREFCFEKFYKYALDMASKRIRESMDEIFHTVLSSCW